MQLTAKIQNKSVNWSTNLRPKVMDVVTYLGSTYQNTTGKNSEPSIGNDWFLVSGLIVGVGAELSTGNSILLTNSEGIIYNRDSPISSNITIDMYHPHF